MSEEKNNNMLFHFIKGIDEKLDKQFLHMQEMDRRLGKLEQKTPAIPSQVIYVVIAVLASMLGVSNSILG